MILNYCDIQYKRMNRYIIEFGLHPIVGYILAALIFIGLSKYLFYKAPYAVYFYMAIAIFISLMIDSHGRNDFFKTIFSSKTFRQIRILENITIVIPFALYLVYEHEVIASLCSFTITFLIAFLPRKTFSSKAFPTPFSFQPFEFAVGIRMAYLLYFALYFILLMAIRVHNFNLGIATIIAVFIISFTFYSNLEAQSYIWNFKGSSKMFLKKKIAIAIAHVSLLSLPILAILLFAWIDQAASIIGLQAIGYVYLVTFVLAKYSAYPRIMSVPQGLIFIFSLWIPPLLIFIIPYLYIKSTGSLKSLLP
jgi:hypothetical protein